ncbi:STAS/SEC14 domain-containing protein [Nannocystis bainbridge]|uniref:STAS/SEC14 domain-containing protein n=1 Tax=Nannocystis bainbridge TaxID=2995303 RepID=A0ABT5E8T3_9BACT|nr:STAS/SEC14 domain-containing protein [Nannocystis bainbridge]MDC0722277.1 STAS/SEC14 domain-containing protein [Nannocystis bainbridge]
MPFVFAEATTPQGKPLLRIHVRDEVTITDAEALGARIEDDGPNHRWRILSVVEKGTEYSPAARRYFPNLQPKYGAIAVAVTSPIVRAAINMMMRLTGQAPNLRLFSSEAEALAWLDQLEI